MLVLVASLSAIDGVCCPDGCTHEQESPLQPRNQESANGICLLCLGGLVSAVRQDLSSDGVVMDGIELPPAARHFDAPSKPLDHPPRS